MLACQNALQHAGMESLIKNSSPVGVKFEAEFLMSISCIFRKLLSNILLYLSQLGQPVLPFSTF
jgi:hypothetical protein